MYNGKNSKHYRIDEKREKLECEKQQLEDLAAEEKSNPDRLEAIKRMIARIDLQLSPPLTPSY